VRSTTRKNLAPPLLGIPESFGAKAQKSEEATTVPNDPDAREDAHRLIAELRLP
jgi:hypothetical protein